VSPHARAATVAVRLVALLLLSAGLVGAVLALLLAPADGGVVVAFRVLTIRQYAPAWCALLAAAGALLAASRPLGVRAARGVG
jgi:hypothetical protein